MKISIQKRIKDIPYYPKALMYGMDEGWVRLSSNENPFPPSPKVFASILDSLFYMNRYPGGELELKEAIAQKFKITPQEIIIGNGSNEIIETVLRAMIHEKKKGAIIPEPSFAFYSIASMIYGYEVKKVPLKNMRIDFSAIMESLDGGTRIIFLNNPVNPTGTIFEEDAFVDFLKQTPQDVLVVVDEAYGEFVEDKNFPRTYRLINDFPVVVLKTFSKAYGLAGLRVGYGIGEASLVSFLERTKQPFSINMVALVAALAALKDQSYLKKVLANNRKGKRFFAAALKEISLSYIPTETNFMLIHIGPHAEDIVKRLFEEKVLVRWMGPYGLAEYIRVTIGRMDENIRFIETLKRILK